MAYKGECQFCGIKLSKKQHICGTCSQKRKLIRQMKRILAEIEKAERKEEND